MRVCLSTYVCVSLCVCVTYSFWCAGGLRVLDIYANHFVVLAVIMDQDMQARTAGTARVSNQIPKSSDMFTVHRSYDLAILLLC